MTVSDNTLADMDALISRALATSSGLNRILPTDTLATLKAQTPFAGAVVFMQGRATERDGGEGIFIWNAAPRRWRTMASGATGRGRRPARDRILHDTERSAWGVVNRIVR